MEMQIGSLVSSHQVDGPDAPHQLAIVQSQSGVKTVPQFSPDQSHAPRAFLVD